MTRKWAMRIEQGADRETGESKSFLRDKEAENGIARRKQVVRK
jgi:hypothetical protein